MGKLEDKTQRAVRGEKANETYRTPPAEKMKIAGSGRGVDLYISP